MSAFSVQKVDGPVLHGADVLFDEYRALYGCASDVPAAAAFLRERLQRSESVLFVASRRGVAAGFAQLYPSHSSVLMSRTFVLNDLYVRHAYRRKGVGRLLVDAVAGFARQAGATGITLSTEASNAIAQKLYLSAGWSMDTQFRSFHLQFANDVVAKEPARSTGAGTEIAAGKP